MPEYPHFSNYPLLSEALVDFGQLAREHGLNVGVQESLDVLSVMKQGGLLHQEQFRYALRALYCTTPEETTTFDRLFDWFWKAERLAVQGKTTLKNQSNIKKRNKRSLVMMGKGEQQEAKEEARNVSGANTIHRLRKTDFTKISDIDSAYLEQLALQLWQQMSLRLKRRMKQSRRRGQIDLRQTIRASIGQGGEPFKLRFKHKKKRKQRLIILLDVSGSMDKYSFFLLRFLCALGAHFERVEAFIFSTTLLRITPYLQTKQLAQTLRWLSAKADHWSSGTKIGACLQTFNREYAKTVLNGHSTTIILSDGLDTGEPEDLAKELKKIKLRTNQLIWLNPLKGMSGYEPVQRGMQAALPQVDVFRSAHNLNSILELEELLLSI